MAIHDWRKWNRQEWNDALVDAVFCERATNALPVTRIDSTSKFLGRVAGAVPDDIEEAREQFVDCFRGRASQVRTLFDADIQARRWSPQHRELPFFAQLYLSLIVASADHETYEIGNFRDRLIALLRLPSDTSLSLYGLAELWKKARAWTRKTQRKHVRRLELPEAGREVIIGYSKRLAFPAYRDQVRLASVLSEAKLDLESPVTDVMSAVSRERHRFSQWFCDEFREFTRLIDAARYESAMRCPFWGAVADISWEHRPSKRVGRVAEFQLELDVVDPYGATVRLMSDAPLPEDIKGWRSKSCRHAEGEYKHEIVPSQQSSTLIEALAEGLGRSFLRRTSISRSLERECVLFIRDEYGRWVSASKFVYGEDCWLLVHPRGIRVIHANLSASRKRTAYDVDFCLPSGWRLLGPTEATESLRVVLEKSFPTHDLFHLRLRPLRIQIQGGLRLPEGYLFCHPVLPRLKLASAARMEWTALQGRERLVACRNMVQQGTQGDPSFWFDDSAQCVNEAARLEVVAFDASDEELDSVAIEVVPACRSWITKRPNDMSRWLVTGESGQLVGAVPDAEDQEQSTNEATDPDLLALRPLLKLDHSLPLPRRLALEEVPADYNRALEVLTATFIRAAGVPQGDFFHLVSALWGLNARETWQQITDLTENGIVQQLFSRHWHGGSFRAAQPAISAIQENGKWLCRVSGLVPGVLRRQIASIVEAAGSTCHILASSTGATVGALEFHLKSWATVLNVSESARLPLEPALVDPWIVPSWARIFFSEPDQAVGNMRVWSDVAGGFVEDGGAPVQPPRLERWRAEGMQQVFVLKFSGRRWTTRSRSWAFLARASVTGMVGEVDAQGSVRILSQLQMPPAISRGVLRYGGGVCFRDANGMRIYPGGLTWAPARMLMEWMPDADCIVHRGSRAHNRLQRTLARQFGEGLAATLSRGWARIGRTGDAK